MRIPFTILVLVGLTACAEEKKSPPAPPKTAATPAPPPVWPEKGAQLIPKPPAFPKNFGKRRVFIDAGHGSPGNSGNTSSLCIDEQDHNLRVAKSLKTCLDNTGHFEILLSRRDGQQVKYRQRLKAANKFGARAILSIHSDARGAMGNWSPEPGKNCPHNKQEPGFSILWSDDGRPGLVARRLALARSIATAMSTAGFLAYNGVDYEDLYVQDKQVPGVFVDRHQPGKRIFFLRKPKIPSVIIETHHAWDPREERRFQDPQTLEAFCQSLGVALADFLAPAKVGF